MSEKPTMETVARWTGHVSPHERGGFVAYGDYLTLERERDALREALREAMMDCDHMLLSWSTNPQEWAHAVRKMQGKMRALLGKGAG